MIFQVKRSSMEEIENSIAELKLRGFEPITDIVVSKTHAWDQSRKFYMVKMKGEHRATV